MDEIFNDPIISHFLQSVKEDNKSTTVKQLILLGIHAVNSKIHQNSCKCANLCPCVKVHNPYFQNQAVSQNYSDINLAKEINQMRIKIDELAARANYGNTHQPDAFIHRQQRQRNPSRNKQNIETIYQRTVENETEGTKKQFRHHLDDSQVRKVLVNPYAPASPIKKQKRKEQLQKLHQIQKQKDAMEIKTLKERAQKQEKQYETIQHKITNVHHSTDEKRKRPVLTSINDEYNNQQNDKQFKRSKNSSVIETKSKIKSLIQKDKEKTKMASSKRVQQQKRAKLCQFQYSDEEQSISDDVKDESECPVHSRYRENDQSHEQYSRQQKMRFKQSHTQSKNHQQQSAQQQDDQSQQKQADQVSQSSSFSKFSMSSLRENGKISSKSRR